MREQFRNPALYDEAITHGTYAHERGGPSYQRLEFLGDAVLQLCVSEALLERYPTRDPGDLTELRKALVWAPTLAGVARAQGLVQRARFGRGASQDGTRDGEKVQSDLVESLLGAVYLDRGFLAAKELVEAWVLPLADSVDPRRALAQEDAPVASRRGSVSPISALMEWSQRNHGGEVPAYDFLADEGPPHKRRFHARVSVAGEALGEGWGGSKPGARAAAAADALARLGIAW